MHLVTFVRVYNMHQDTKSARLIVVCQRTLGTLRGSKVSLGLSLLRFRIRISFPFIVSIFP